MAINFPGPYELRIFYTPTSLTTPIIQHVNKVNVSLVETAAQGDDFANYDINDKDGATTVALSTVVEDYLTLLMASYPNTVDVDAVELWKYATAQSFDSVFWSSYTPTANVGTGTGTIQPAQQNIYVFRSAEGGIMKLSPMETLQPAGAPESYASLEAYQSAIVDFILDGDGATYTAPFLARDTSYPFSFKQMFPGQAEDLWKKRNGRK